MPHIFDISQFPLVNAGLIGDIGPATMLEYEADVLGLLNRGSRFAMVFNTIGVGDIERSIITLHAEFFKKNREKCAQQWVGLALVFKGATLRFMLSSLMLIVPLPMPHLVVHSVEEGRRFAVRRLLEEKIPLSSTLQSYL